MDTFGIAFAELGKASPTILGAVVTICVCFFIWTKFGKCLACRIVAKVKKERDEYKNLWEGAVSHLETKRRLNKEIKDEMHFVREELKEHKQIMLDIVKALSNTTLIQNEILVRLKIQNRE